MKKTIVAIVLASSVAAVAFASLSNRTGSKQAIEKKQEHKEVKKECKKRCIFG